MPEQVTFTAQTRVAGGPTIPISLALTPGAYDKLQIVLKGAPPPASTGAGATGAGATGAGATGAGATGAGATGASATGAGATGAKDAAGAGATGAKDAAGASATGAKDAAGASATGASATGAKDAAGAGATDAGAAGAGATDAGAPGVIGAAHVQPAANLAQLLVVTSTAYAAVGDTNKLTVEFGSSNNGQFAPAEGSKPLDLDGPVVICGKDALAAVAKGWTMLRFTNKLAADVTIDVLVCRDL